MKIYVITHKEFQPVMDNSCYVPMLVGANKNVGKENYIKDNSEIDNISDLNSSFCEMTGAYWMWKHSTEDIVGLAHYRRYFIDKATFFNKASRIISEEKVEEILHSYDMILSERSDSDFKGMTAKEYFYEKHDKVVWENLREIIAKDYPDFLEDFEWFENQKSGYICNMFISKKAIFNDYSEWAFDILFKLHDLIDYSKYDNYNTRMIGFVAERIFNVWIRHQVRTNSFRVKELPIYLTDNIVKLYYLYYKRVFSQKLSLLFKKKLKNQ
ncbi:TPA: DUF4422 domain-containing protein [Streptococcus suis]